MAIDYAGVMKDAQGLGMLTTDELDSLSNEVASGTIVKLNYDLLDEEEEQAEYYMQAIGSSTVPYQIQLDSGNLIFCTVDDDGFIRTV